MCFQMSTPNLKEHKRTRDSVYVFKDMSRWKRYVMSANVNIPRVKHSNEQEHKVKVKGLEWGHNENFSECWERKTFLMDQWFDLSERVRVGTAGERNIPSSQLSRLDFTTTSHAWLICFRKKEKAFQDRTSGLLSCQWCTCIPLRGAREDNFK